MVKMSMCEKYGQWLFPSGTDMGRQLRRPGSRINEKALLILLIYSYITVCTHRAKHKFLDLHILLLIPLYVQYP